MNPDTIFPLIVPKSYYAKGAWELPHQELAHREFILTWVFITGKNAMGYITAKDVTELNANHPGWQRRAFENLRNSITETENIFTHYSHDKSRERLKYLAFMHSDGLGSSRVLLSHEISKAFPEGYFVAFPDRSCGMVISAAIKDKELQELKKLVKKMYKGATIPMAGDVLPPQSVSLPKDWLEPIDSAYSEVLVKEIQDLRNA